MIWCMHCEKIPPIKLINTSVTSHICLWLLLVLVRRSMFYSLNKFRLYNTVVAIWKSFFFLLLLMKIALKNLWRVPRHIQDTWGTNSITQKWCFAHPMETVLKFPVNVGFWLCSPWTYLFWSGKLGLNLSLQNVVKNIFIYNRIWVGSAVYKHRLFTNIWESFGKGTL